MSTLLSQVSRGKLKPPVLCLVTGPAGVGKTTFGAGAPAPIFLGPESGTSFLDVARFPSPKNFDQVMTGVRELTTDEHEYRTLVLDSLDWLEPLVWDKVCLDGGEKQIEDFGYGKGYVAALKLWQQMISELTVLREKRAMNVVLIAHCQIKKFEDPRTNSAYDRYVMKLHDKASALWKEYVDVMGFAAFDVVTAKDKSGKERAYGGEIRVLHTVYSAAWDAKNRMGLPNQLPLSWDAFLDAYNRGAPVDLEALRKSVDWLVARAPVELRPKVEQAIEAAGNDTTKLSVIENRLKTLVL